jgi:hypothetical protein
MKTPRTLIHLLLFVSAVSFTSCRKDWNGVRGDGPILTEDRIVSSFHGVEYHLEGDVNIRRDSVFSVTVSSYGNYLPLIRTEVIGGKLIISSSKSLRDNEITVDVAMPSLDHLSLSGSGDIRTIDRFADASLYVNLSGSGKVSYFGDVNDLRANISGSGTMDLDGTAEDATMTMSGSGKIAAYGMIVNNNTATISGSGNIETFVSQHLDATISGSGTIRYHGNPSVTTHISGSGSVVRVP